MPTVIDSLVVTVGLDSSGLKKDQQDVKKETKQTEATLVQEAKKTEAANEKIRKQKAAAEAKAQKQKEATAKKSAEETRRKNKLAEADAKKSRDNIASTFKETLGAFGIALGLKELIGFLIDLNQSTRQLGLDSKNFGQASEELRNWQNAAVAAGGTAEDATNAVAGFQQAIFNLRTQGNVSPQLLMQFRVGLDIRDAKGELKALDQFALEAATAIEKQHVSRAQAFQLANAIGLPGGLANIVAEGRKATEDFLAEQKKKAQFTKKNVEVATRVTRGAIETSQAVGAFVKNAVLNVEGKILDNYDSAPFDKKRRELIDSLSLEDRKTFRNVENGKADTKSLEGIKDLTLRRNAQQFIQEENLRNAAKAAEIGEGAATDFAPNPNATQFNQGIQPTPGASSTVNNNSQTSGQNVNVQIDNVKVVTQSKDPEGVADAFSNTVMRKSWAANSVGSQQ